VAVETARDRLTFLELDLAGLNRNDETAGLATNIWYR